MKRIISVMLMLSTILASFSLSGIIGVAAGDAYIFNADFEECGLGSTPDVIGDTYTEVASVNFPQTLFSYISDGIDVQRESETINNKVLRFYNDSKEIKNMEMTKSLRIDTSNGGTHVFDVSFRLKSLGNTCGVTFQNYGGGVGGSLRPFTLNGTNISCMGSVGSSIEGDKWNNIKISFDLDANVLDLYVNGVKEYTGAIFENHSKIELPKVMVMRITSSLGEKKQCFWDDFRVEESKNANDKISDNFAMYENMHPRLMVTSDDFERISAKRESEAFKDEWNSMVAMTEKYVANGVTEYYEHSNPEETWMRDYVDDLTGIAFVTKLTGDSKYRKYLSESVINILNYPQWGRDEFLNSDLACAHALVFLSLYYDWFYDDIGPNERYLLINTVRERGGAMARLGWWRESYLQNHSWNCAASLMVAAAAFYDEIPEAKNWANISYRLYEQIFKYLGDDGASHEGIMYWGYGFRFMAYYLEMANKFLGVDYSGHGYVKNAIKFFSAMLLPTSPKLSPIRFADYSTTIEDVTPGILTYIAKKNQDPLAQWYVNYMRSNVDQENKHLYALFYMLYYDDELVPQSPEELNVPTETYFDDMGFLFMRTDWTENQTVVAYRCGPALGKKARNRSSRGDLGTSHIHNDINSMQIFSRGVNLLAEDIYGGGDTASHNTILVNNYGHMTDNGPNNGFVPIAPRGADANPHIDKIVENDNFVYSIGDGTEIYDKEKTGLLKFKRHFIYVKPDMLLITDEIETEKRDEKIPVEIRYFPEEQNFTPSREGKFTFKTDKYNLVIRPIVDGRAKAEGTKVMKVYTGDKARENTVIRITNDESSFLQPVAMSWSDPDKEPEEVVARKLVDGVVEFYTDDAVITLDTLNENVTYTPVETDTIVKKDGVIVMAEGDLIFENSRFFANENQLKQYFGIDSERDGNVIVYTLGGIAARMEVNSDEISVGGRFIKSDEKCFERNGSVYAPLRFVLQAFNMDCTWNESNSNLYVSTGIDFSDASLHALIVNGNSIEVKDGTQTYTVPVFGEKVEISAAATVPSADVTYKICDGLHGTSQITITSIDKTDSKTYTVETEPYSDICGTIIYNLGYSESDGNVGANAIDHNFDTRWAAPGVGQYLWYDLGKITAVESVKLSFYNGDKRTTEFDIELSDDGVNYTKAGHFVSSGKTNDLEEYKLENARARYVRFYGYGAQNSGWNSITEMGIITGQ